jgi:hypothetical protein
MTNAASPEGDRIRLRDRLKVRRPNLSKFEASVGECEIVACQLLDMCRSEYSIKGPASTLRLQQSVAADDSSLYPDGARAALAYWLAALLKGGLGGDVLFGSESNNE